MNGVLARARLAWYETCQEQNRLMLASCVLIPFYSNALRLVCTVAADHLRIHVVGNRVQLQVVAFLHVWCYTSAARFHDRRHVTKNSKKMTLPPREASFRLGQHGSSRVYGLWIVVCVLISV
eukprot:6464336-Amphidinium_carterae.1